MGRGAIGPDGVGGGIAFGGVPSDQETSVERGSSC